MNNFLLEGNSTGMTEMLVTFGPIVLMILVFYFLIMRPQKKQEKEIASMRNNLAVGDEVTTIGGIIGRITHIKDDVVTIETGADRNKIRFRKSAIQTVDKKFGEEKAPKGGYKVKKADKKADEKAEKVIEEAPLKEDK